MKILGINFGKEKKEITTSVQVKPEPFLSTFSSTFKNVPEGNLVLPHIMPRGNGGWVPFGADNLYPQFLNQMYYYSPLHNGIVNYKVLSVIGNGFELSSAIKTPQHKVDEYVFVKKNNLNSMARQLTNDLVLHGRVCVLVNKSENGKVSLKRLGPETIRVYEDKTKFDWSPDWSRRQSIKTLSEYDPSILGESLYYYEIDLVAGQEYYPLPHYTAAMHDIFLDGEMAYLQKSNIVNSIYPSFMITLAKKFGSDAELQQYKNTIENAKGAPNAGRILSFIAPDGSSLPTITPIPTNNNDKLFTETTKRVDDDICRVHLISPLLMGIRVPGSLGQGNELEKEWTIFQHTFVKPTRLQIEEILNDLFEIGGVASHVTVRDYQIIDNVIVDKTQKTKI